MGKTPSISVITVCRNSAATIRETIDSVLLNKEYLYEYIIIDGASSDGTQDIVRSYGNEIDIFMSEPDSGIADAFNKGIAHATGDIIAIINSDDRLLPEALKKVIGCFQEQPDVDVIHADILLYRGDSFIKRLSPPDKWWYPWRLVLFNHPATFVKKKVYEDHGGFAVDYKVAMDVEIFARWTTLGLGILYYPMPLVRMSAGGISSQNARLGYQEARKALISHNYQALPVHLQYYGKLLIDSLLRACSL
jgi:glycosyltransferase involved in cell wall biosynthesis